MMARRVFWRSWSRLEADYELDRFKGLPFQHEWVDAHKHNPGPEDIWLTTNGYDWRGNCPNGTLLPRRATLYAESFQYLRNEYVGFQSNRQWSHRFHFCPTYTNFPNTTLHLISCYWKQEGLGLFSQTVQNKKPEFTFGMVLAKKPMERPLGCEFGYMRTKVVEAGQNRSFRHYGAGWPTSPTYGGEKFVHGHRGSPAKFHDARILMTKAKFVFCLENIHDPIYSVNYLTEKIFHGFLSASVPIYAGAWNVEHLIPPDIFIDLRKFDMDPAKAMDHCEKMSDTEYQGYLDRIGAWLTGPGQSFSMEERYTVLDRHLTRIFG
jgi:hypothetical protein